MIGAFLEFLRRTTSQNSAETIDYSSWKEEFENILKKSEQRPGVLVDLARKGFPENLRGWAWCRILRIEEVPELVKLFGTVDPIHFQAPCFGSPLDLARVSLSPSQLDTIKKLLCIIGQAHQQLEYAPIIPAMVSMLTKCLGPNDVLACMAAMIEGHAIPASKREDWAYFPMHRRDYLVFERVFEDLINTFAPKVSKLVLKIQLVHREFLPDWDRVLSGLFISLLPCRVAMRVFDSYLVEGYKILLRYAIAHVIVRQGALLTCNDPEKFNAALVAPIDYHDGLFETYFKIAMTVKFERSIIQRYRNRRRKHSIGDFDSEDKLLIFQRPLPQLQKPSSFMGDEDWMRLWSWIPPRYRLFNLDLIFTTAEHGRHTLNIFDRCNGFEPLLILVETISGKVIGAYASKALTLEHGHRFYGTGETFIFSILPKPFKYEWKTSSGSMAFICTTMSFIAFGGGSDFGLWIDKLLIQVASAQSITFGNEPLLDKQNPEDWRIHCLEVFRFV